MTTLADILIELPDLDDTDLHMVMRTAREILAGRESTDLRDVVRAFLAGHYGRDDQIVAVKFGTMQYDDGWFYSELSATLIAVDGTEVKGVSIDDAEDQLRGLSDANGPLGREAGLVVNLETGEVDDDPYMFA